MYFYVFPRIYMLPKRSTGSSNLYYSPLSLCDVVALDILLDCYAIGMTGRLFVSYGAIHYRILFM